MRSIRCSFSPDAPSAVRFGVRLLRRRGRRRRFGGRLPAAQLRLTTLQVLSQGRSEPLAPPPILIPRVCPSHAVSPTNCALDRLPMQARQAKTPFAAVWS
jgi:hypothetical protein